MSLSFYDIDKDYIKYLQKYETEKRGFTRVPNVEYPGHLPKFTCGIVLEINNYKYYVPVSSYTKQQPDNILIKIPSEKYRKIKGSLRFNYMIPVPDDCIKERIISNDPNKKLLYLEWNFCNKNELHIKNKARQTYSKVINKVNDNIVLHSCDFVLLETLCSKYKKKEIKSKTNLHKLELKKLIYKPVCFNPNTYIQFLKKIKKNKH